MSKIGNLATKVKIWLAEFGAELMWDLRLDSIIHFKPKARRSIESDKTLPKPKVEESMFGRKRKRKRERKEPEEPSLDVLPVVRPRKANGTGLEIGRGSRSPLSGMRPLTESQAGRTIVGRDERYTFYCEDIYSDPRMLSPEPVELLGEGKGVEPVIEYFQLVPSCHPHIVQGREWFALIRVRRDYRKYRLILPVGKAIRPMFQEEDVLTSASEFFTKDELLAISRGKPLQLAKWNKQGSEASEGEE